MSEFNYRLYSFAHSWLSGVQKGIQTQHATVKLLTGPMKNWGQTQIWATDDQTTIVLEGGGTAALEHTLELVMASPFACACFYEDQESLNGSITAVVFVAPEYFWNNTLENYKEFVPEDLWELFVLMKTAPKAS